MNTLTAREKRLVAVGLLFAVVLLVGLGVILPVVNGFTDRADTKASLLRSYSSNDRLISAIPQWREEANILRTTSGQFAIASPSAAAAAEILKARVIRLVASHGGEIKAAQEMQAATGFVKIRSDIQLSLIQLTDSLKDLQNQPPYISIDAITIAADRALETGHLTPMDVRLEISAPYIAPASR